VSADAGVSGVHKAAAAPAAAPAAAAVGPPWLRLVVCAGPAAGKQFEAHTNRQEVRVGVVAEADRRVCRHQIATTCCTSGWCVWLGGPCLGRRTAYDAV
jgi:hypothetical protein